MNRISKAFICLTLLGGLSVLTVFGQTATSFQITKSKAKSGKLYITVKGKKRKIADNAREAWLINKGREIVYTFQRPEYISLGARGELINLYSVATGETREILSQYTRDVVGLTEVSLSNGEKALLIRLVTDPKDRAPIHSYFSVVDPKRGEVLRRRSAEFSEIKGDNAKIIYYQSNDWETIFEPRSGKEDKNKTAIPMKVKAKIKRTENLDLKNVLKNESNCRQIEGLRESWGRLQSGTKATHLLPQSRFCHCRLLLPLFSSFRVFQCISPASSFI